MENINRRDFLRMAGAAGVGAGLAACTGKNPVAEAAVANPAAAPGEMTYRQFSSLDGDEVSILGYGCMRWPLLPEPAPDGNVVDQEAVNRLIDYALEHGVNYFDTSPVYLQGWSEAVTGNALARHPRDSYYLATKMSNRSDFSYDYGVKMYYDSMKRLQTDYIDYYLLHNIGRPGNFKERFLDNGLLDFLIKEREEGRIRHLGWSFHGSRDEFDYILSLHDEYHWDFVQIQLNYCDWRHASGMNVNAEYLYGELEAREIPVVIMEPLQGGRLSNVPDHIVARLKARNPEGSVASWAFRFAGSHKMVLTALSGMTYMEHLQDNLKTYSPLISLTDEEKEFLYETADLIVKYPTVPCNDCKYCMPCPYGIDIPAIFTYYNRCVNEGSIPTNSQSESYRKARRNYLIGYDRAVPKLRQADHCIGCGQCVKHCPQDIRIPGELRKIDHYVDQLKQGKI